MEKEEFGQLAGVSGSLSMKAEHDIIPDPAFEVLRSRESAAHRDSRGSADRTACALAQLSALPESRS